MGRQPRAALCIDSLFYDGLMIVGNLIGIDDIISILEIE